MSSPTRVLLLTLLSVNFAMAQNFVSVAGGSQHSLALAGDGVIYAWGENGSGELGNGSNTDSNIPVAVIMTGVLAGKTITALAGGQVHTLALASDGTVYAWGDGNYGQLGNGASSSSNVPVAVDMSGVLSGKTVIAIAGGGFFSLALASDGTVYAWGDGFNGELGTGTETFSNSPVAVDMSGVLSGKSVTAIAAGHQHSVALTSDGGLYTWGIDTDPAWSRGVLGRGANTDTAYSPVAIDMSGVLSGKTVTAIAAGDFASLVLASDGTLYTWGSNWYGELGNGLDAFTNGDAAHSNVPVAVDMSGALSGKTGTAIGIGTFRSLVLASDGMVYTWGTNDSGELGIDSFTESTVPVAVDVSGVLAGKTVTGIANAARATHALAVASDGTAYAWGYNASGQLGNGSNTLSKVPVLVGAPPAPIMTVTPATLSFGEVDQGSTGTLDVKIKNTGDAELSVNAPAITCADSAHFSASTATITLAAGDSVNLAVEFSPTSAGALTASLDLTSNGGDVSVPLDGTGKALPAGSVIFSEGFEFGIGGWTSFSFAGFPSTNIWFPTGGFSFSGSFGIGFQNDPQDSAKVTLNSPSLDLTDFAGQPLTLKIAHTRGNEGVNDFVPTFSLWQGSALLFSTTFNIPSFGGWDFASFDISAGAGLSGITFGFTYEGFDAPSWYLDDIEVTNSALTVPVLTVTPASLSFGEVDQGSADTLDVKIKNTGDAELSVDAPAITGTDSAHFSASTATITLAAGE